jgi:hypothetical protein
MKKTKGLETEKLFSKSFHSFGIPILVSAKLLRQRQLGQLDLVRLKKDLGGWMLEVGEVKSSMIGLESMERSQKKRISAAQNFLSGIFSARTRLLKLYDAGSEVNQSE